MDNGEFQKALYSASPELSREIRNELMTPPGEDVMLEKKARECEEKVMEYFSYEDKMKLLAFETGRAMLKTLETVRRVLKRFRIPAYRYSVGSEEEEKDNLFYENGHLMVTYVERGGRCFEKSYDNIDEACMMFFTRVIDSKIKRRWAIRYYRRLRLGRVRQHAARL